MCDDERSMITRTRKPDNNNFFHYFFVYVRGYVDVRRTARLGCDVCIDFEIFRSLSSKLLGSRMQIAKY